MGDLPDGHRLDHPLIYPDLVSLVAGWDGDGMELVQRLRKEWYPHHASPLLGARRWSEDDPGWQEWTELREGRDLVGRVARWAADNEHSDTSLAWQSAWGTTDPDKSDIAPYPA